jgi:hypothetical protein
MQYLLLIYIDEQTLPDAKREECYIDSTAYAHRLNDAGKYVAAAPLHSVTTATSIRVREGRRMVTDGPFAETREQLGGFFMVNAQDLDEAMEIAAGIPGAKFGTVEIRPVMELPQLQLPENFSARGVESAAGRSI